VNYAFGTLSAVTTCGVKSSKQCFYTFNNVNKHLSASQISSQMMFHLKMVSVLTETRLENEHKTGLYVTELQSYVDGLHLL
jgi:hypothetical protein